MLAELCKELNNWDFQKRAEKYIGNIAIQGGNVVDFEDKIKDGQYFRIIGSLFNDGIDQYPAAGLHDEEFDGAVWAMAIPEEVIALAEKIADWRDEYESVGSKNMSPYTSESFGGYSYTKASGGSGNSGSPESGVTWQSQFRRELNKWRKI